ncbi:hypothetical protein ACOSQ3_004240 [Xanthoceras sorbifolium]
MQLISLKRPTCLTLIRLYSVLHAHELVRIVEIVIGGYNNARGGNRSRGRGGRYGNRSGQKIHCQLCAKLGHSALQCYRRFDQQFQAFYATPETVADQSWYVDSGATNHITADMNNLSMRSEYRGKEKLIVGNGNQLTISHIGDTKDKRTKKVLLEGTNRNGLYQLQLVEATPQSLKFPKTDSGQLSCVNRTHADTCYVNKSAVNKSVVVSKQSQQHISATVNHAESHSKTAFFSYSPSNIVVDLRQVQSLPSQQLQFIPPQQNNVLSATSS